MANPHKGDVPIKAGDKDYVLRFDIDALCQLEEKTGKTFLELGQKLEAGSVSVARATLWAGLRKHHKEVTLEQAGDLMLELGGVIGALPHIALALKVAFPEANGNENPPTGQDGTGPNSSSSGAVSG